MRLAEAGAPVARAEGLESGLAALSRPERPDLVIVDCALGPEATNRLARAARAAGAPKSLVLFSPFERRAFGQTSLKGFDGWLVKPVRARSLYERLAAEFSASRRPADARRRAAARSSPRTTTSTPSSRRRRCPPRFRVVRATDGEEAVRLAAPAGRPPAVRPHPDGPQDAGPRRARGHAPPASPGGRPPAPADADRRAHRERPRGRSGGPAAAGFDAFLVKPFDFDDLARSRAPAAARPTPRRGGCSRAS